MKKNENVIWQKNKVSYEDRCRVLGQQGKVVGAGEGGVGEPQEIDDRCGIGKNAE